MQVVVENPSWFAAWLLGAQVVVLVDVNFKAIMEWVGRAVRTQPEGRPPAMLAPETDARFKLPVEEFLVRVDAGAANPCLLVIPVSSDDQLAILEMDAVFLAWPGKVPLVQVQFAVVEFV